MKTDLHVLQKNIQGDVLPTVDVEKFSTDESMFKILPVGIVCPKNEADVVSIIQWAGENKIPITARGGGTGVAGQSIGSGLVVDFSKYMNHILDILDEKVLVEPGVVLGDLNNQLSDHGLKIGPDPGSQNRCTIGGMIATNASGPHALMYGSTRDHVRSLNLVLSNGKSMNGHQLGVEMDSYVREIVKHKNLIQKSKRNVDKNSSGYFLEGLLEQPASFEKLIVGSEGTLAMVTQAELNLVPIPEKISFAVFGFQSMGQALTNVKSLRESKASCIELLDATIIQTIRKENPSFLNELGIENAKVSLWVEWCGEVPSAWKNLAKFSTSSQLEIQKIWKQRSSVSTWLHAQAVSQNRKPLRCIEDACVPMDQLVSFVMEATDLLERHDCKGAIFGHVGNGHLHINPGIRTDLPNLPERIETLMDKFYELVIGLGGTISGEHGDGILRTSYAKKQWKEIWPLFEFVKRSFDPQGIFNSDRKVPMQTYRLPALKY